MITRVHYQMPGSGPAVQLRQETAGGAKAKWNAPSEEGG